jgi:hypothetical protein
MGIDEYCAHNFWEVMVEQLLTWDGFGVRRDLDRVVVQELRDVFHLVCLNLKRKIRFTFASTFLGLLVLEFALILGS